MHAPNIEVHVAYPPLDLDLGAAEQLVLKNTKYSIFIQTMNFFQPISNKAFLKA